MNLCLSPSVSALATVWCFFRALLALVKAHRQRIDYRNVVLKEMTAQMLVSGASTAWSRLYKEGRGISPEHFTFADVGSIKAMGFFYMVIGVFWFGGSLFAR